MSGTDARLQQNLLVLQEIRGLTRSWNVQFSLASKTMVIPAGKRAIAIAVGAGGSGGRWLGTQPKANGGNGGDLVISEIAAPTTELTLTIAVGAGGVGVTTNVNGNTGGSTTITGTDVSIVATGGTGGNAAGAANAANAANAASTGDIVFKGGVAGRASVRGSSGGGSIFGHTSMSISVADTCGGGASAFAPASSAPSASASASLGALGFATLAIFPGVVVDSGAGEANVLNAGAVVTLTGVGQASGGGVVASGSVRTNNAGLGAGSGGCSASGGTATGSGNGGNGFAIILIEV